MQADFVFSSESVTAGHPDKVCDQISDAIVDRHLRQDPLARVSAECAISTGIVFISVKARSKATVDAPAAAREVLRQVGYANDGGFDARSCTIMTSFHDFGMEGAARGIEEEVEDAAVDQIMAHNQATVFGFACNDTVIGMPLPIWLAHRLARSLGELQYEHADFSPDGKTQVAIEYRDHKPARIHSITLVACQHVRHSPTPEQVASLVRERVIQPVFQGLPLHPDERTRIAVNPEGPMAPGGPVLHAGLTGRKTAVDGYGDFARSGAAALSGKDPSRVDRIGSYAARHVARNVVAAGLSDRCEVQLSYAIGQSQPVSMIVDTFGTGRMSEAALASRIGRVFDLRPAAIVRRFGLRSISAQRQGVFYRRLAAYGQVGREDVDLPWERTDCVEALRG